MILTLSEVSIQFGVAKGGTSIHETLGRFTTWEVGT